jgi:hypothetical protein
LSKDLLAVAAWILTGVFSALLAIALLVLRDKSMGAWDAWPFRSSGPGQLAQGRRVVAVALLGFSLLCLVMAFITS